MTAVLKPCTNHPDRPVQPPSRVLCAECFAALSAKMKALLHPLGTLPPRVRRYLAS